MLQVVANFHHDHSREPARLVPQPKRLPLLLLSPLALLLAGATGADFLLTTVQAMNLHQRVAGPELLFVISDFAVRLFPISDARLVQVLVFLALFLFL